MDFPAAHSMDTMWFAVDADGHVAAFDTGEGGAVPEIAFADNPYELATLLRALPETGAKLDEAGHTLDATATHTPISNVGDRVTHVLAFLTELEPVKDLVERLSGTVIAATSGVAVELVVGDRAAFEELHRRGACRHCQWDPAGDESELAAHGVFRYVCGEQSAVPYVRLAVPDKPLALDDVPAEVRAHAIRFAGRFVDSPKLQPAEHWDTQGWGATWLASDGKTVRPFAGREDELDDDPWGDDYVVVRESLELPEGELVGGGTLTTGGAPPSARVASSKKPWWKFW
jgi:hypothetical protein